MQFSITIGINTDLVRSK